MKQMKIGISEQMEQIIATITARNQYKSKSSCVNALLLSHPEIAQEMKTVLQELKSSESEAPDQNEGIMIPEEDAPIEKAARLYLDVIKGTDAVESVTVTGSQTETATETSARSSSIFTKMTLQIWERDLKN